MFRKLIKPEERQKHSLTISHSIQLKDGSASKRTWTGRDRSAGSSHCFVYVRDGCSGCICSYDLLLCGCIDV